MDIRRNMKLFLFIPLLLITNICLASPPTRVSSYTSGSVISSSEVTANEDALFNYLQGGVDSIKDGTIVNADVNASANIQSDKLNLTAMAQNLANTGTFANTGNVTVTGNQTISSYLAVTGTINTTGVYDNGAELIPQGMIMLWSGATSAIPAGWELCDGTCSIACPDLRNSFVVGAGDTYAVDATGGATTHTHTFTTGADLTSTGKYDGSSSSLSTPDHTHTGTTASGSSLPPYYSLAWIIHVL
jgi:hypothetical protein